MDERELYLEDHEFKRTHYRIDGVIYNTKEILSKFNIKAHRFYDYRRGVSLPEFDGMTVEPLENTPEILQEYAEQLGKSFTKKCSICGVTNLDKNIYYNDVCHKYLCEKHGQQFKKFGKFMDNSPISVFDKNHYEVDEETKTVTVDCYDQHGNITGQFKCDLDDLDIVKSCKWRIVHKLNGDYAVTGNQHSRKAYFHSDVLGVPQSYEVDHISGDTLDNRKCNLRQASSTVQKLNRRIGSLNTTGFKGVCNRACDGMYGVDFQIKGKRIYMPRFNKLAEAVYCRFLLEMYYYSEYRNKGNDDNIAKEIAKLSSKDKQDIEAIVNERIASFNEQNPNIKNIINSSISVKEVQQHATN